MERFEWVYHEIVNQAANVKASILSFFGDLPLLRDLPDRAVEWIFVAMVFIVAVTIIYPLIRWSAKVAIGAAIIACVLTLITSMSFWGLLPYTGMGVAIVLFSNKFQME